MDPSLGTSDLHVSQRQQDCHKYPSQGRGISHLKTLKSLLIQVQDEKVGRISWASLRAYEGRSESLECPNDGQHQNKEYGGSQKRNCDVQLLPKPTGPVYPGGIIESGRYVLQCRQENNSAGATNGTPQAQQH